MANTSIPNPHDRFFRESFTRKEAARGFFREYLPPSLLRQLDLQTLHIAKDSFIEQELREHFSDILYTVQYHNAPLYLYLLLEHKSHPWRWVGLQLLGYLVRIWELHRKQHPKQEKLPPILPLVLYHGKENWHIAPNFQSLVAGLDEELRAYVPEFHYRLHDLSHWDDKAIRGEILNRLALLAMNCVLDKDNKERLCEILPLIQEITQHETALEVLEAILRYYVQATQNLDEEDIREVLKLTTIGDDLMQTFIDRYIEEGERRGIQKGMQEGIQKGMQEGEQKGKLEGIQLGEAKVLLRQIELKFGTVSEQDRQRIESADAETLLIWSERVLTAESLTEVFR